MRSTTLAVWVLLAVAGCKKDAPPEAPAAPVKADSAAGAQKPPAEPEPEAEPAPSADARAVPPKDAGAEPEAKSSIQSDDILAREAVVESAKVLHVLIGWRELAPAYRGQMDERAAGRERPAADALAREVSEKAKAGEDFAALMKTHSEDPGSAATGRAYTATPDAPLVPPFKKLALRLNVDEVGVVETAYGWHIIKRIE